MPVPPALLLNRSSFSPEYSPPSPYLSHAAPAIQSIPIAHLTPSPMTFPTLNPSPPPLTSGSDYNTPTLQTPFDTAGPSRVIMVDPSASPSPAPVVEIKSFPHAADLLGAPSEGSSSRRSTPVRGTESVEEDRSTQQFAEPIASPQSAARAVQERLARVRERIAARRAERAVEDMSHRRSHSRHIFDPESPTAMSFDPVRGAAGDVGRIAPRTRAVRDDGADRAAQNHRWRMMAAAQRNTDQPRPIHSEYQPTTIHPEDQPFAATATASTAAASAARAYHAEPQPVHGAFIRQQPSYLSAEPEFAFIDQSLNPNSYVSGPNSDTGPSPFLQAQPEPTVPAPRPPLSFGWESEDRPPTLFRRSQPGWTTHRPLSSTLPPPNAPYASHDHQNSGISQSARARALRERLVQLDELRAVSRPQHIEEDWLSRPPWWNAGGDPNVPRIPASAPFAEFNRSNRLRETDPPQTPTEFRTPHSRWLSAESNADNAARPDRSVVDRWNRSVQQAVDRRLPLEPQRDLRMAQHLGHDFSSARLSALSTAVPEMTSIAQRNLEFEHGAEMLRHRLAAAAGPGGDWDEVWGELRMPVDSIYTGLHDPHTLRNLSESARTARLDRADTTSGFHQGGNTAVPPSRSAPSHPYLRHRQYLAEAAARRQDEINIPLLPRSNNAQAGWSNWMEPDMAEDYLDMMDGDFAYPQPIGIPGVANPEQGYRYRHLSACPVARVSLSFRPDMTEEEKRHVVKMVASSVTRLGSAGRRKMAESVVKSVKFEVWGREGSGTEMVEKEMFCSVCHDEYEDDSEVAVTPCAHMYHKDCLDIWVQQPNISSCPMCRRDLAVLACVQKMVPGKSRDEAVELWKLV